MFPFTFPEATTIAIVASGLLAAGIVKGATGLGYASCALPFLVTAVGLKPAMAMVLIPAMATNISVALGTGHVAETVRRFAPLYVAMLPGIAVGIALLLYVDPRQAVVVLGTTIVLYSLFALLKPQLRIAALVATRLQAPVGFANGVLTGMTGSQVMPLLPFVMALDLHPDRMVQAINLGVLIASTVLAGGLVATGVADTGSLLLSVLAVAPALVGVEIGSRLRAHIPAPWFRSVVLLVLLVSGLGMVLRS